jgi:DNA-binding beta-propeller fold protein YncE
MHAKPTVNLPCVSGSRVMRLKGSEIWVWLAVGLALAGSPLDAGQKNAPAQARRVWPAPPAEPRIALVQTISGPGDLGLTSGSFFGRIARGLAGRPKGADSFSQPQALALDEKGNLCVADAGAAAVCLLDREHKRFYRWEKVGERQFVLPVGVARKGGITYVADSGLGLVLGFDLKGKRVMEISKPLVRPTGLALAGDRLYVADSQQHQIFVFDLKGTQLSSFGQRGSGPGELNYPTHVTVTSGGEILVTDAMNSRIAVFDQTGKHLRAIGSAGDTSGHFSRPKGAAMDRLGNVYAVDALFDNVQIFDGQGRLLLDFGEAGNEPGEFWLPNGIAIGGDDHIYVADSYNKRIQVFKYVGP